MCRFCWLVSNAASRDGQLDETGEAYVPVSTRKGHDLAILRPSLQEAQEVRPFVKLLTESVHAFFNLITCRACTCKTELVQ